MAYSYTTGDGLAVLLSTEPDGSTEPVSVLDQAVRQVKSYLKDTTVGPQAQIDVLKTAGVGFISMYGGSAVPTGYLACDGAAVSRTTYAALFAVLGVAFGAGDSVTTFNVPDLRGRSPVGTGTGDAGYAAAVTRGLKRGVEAVMMTLGMLVPHAHSYTIYGALTGTSGVNPIWANTASTSTGSAGGGTDPIPTVTPQLGIPFIIKY